MKAPRENDRRSSAETFRCLEDERRGLEPRRLRDQFGT